MKKTLLIVGALLTVLSTSASIKDGLVGHFRFTDGAYTDETNNADAVLKAGTKQMVPDRFGNDNCALYFDGSTYLTATANVRDITNEISISVWMSTDETNDVKGALVHKYDGGDSDNGLQIIYNDSISIGGRDESDTYRTTGYTTEMYNDGNWHHIVGTRDAQSTWKLYIDGVLVLVEEFNTTIPATDENKSELQIGNHDMWRDTYFTGILDDIRIYNRALTAEDVTDLYRCAENQETTTKTSICEGESVFSAGNTYSVQGTYVDIIPTDCNDCDSIVTLELQVNPVYTIDTSVVFCPGESFSIGTETYSDAGTYTDILTTSEGCDSTVNLTITFATDGCTSSANELTEVITIVPNPTTQFIVITGGVATALYSSQGVTETLPKSNKVDCSHLTAGQYFIEVETPVGNTIIQSFIKE